MLVLIYKNNLDHLLNEITLTKVLATFFITWFHFKWTVPQTFIKKSQMF